MVGVVGGGRLARLTQPAAIALGVRLRVLVEAAESAETGAVRVVPGVSVGDHRDLTAVAAFAQGCDVLTITGEQVPSALLEALAARGVVVRPSPSALALVRDRAALWRRLVGLGVPCLCRPGGAQPGSGGLPSGFGECPGIRRELVALVARSPSGQAAAWPVAEAMHAGGICREVIAPAPRLDPELAAQATDIALRVAGELDVVGVLAVGMFEVAGMDGAPSLAVHDLVTRPHDSGHWTIDGAITSQFEQHLRAVLDLPLGDPRPRASWSVTASVLGGAYPDLYRSYLHVMARDPGVKVHLDGTAVEPGRVVGHVTVSGDDVDDVRARARHAADFIAGVIDE